jgi:hypothetical protein
LGRLILGFIRQGDKEKPAPQNFNRGFRGFYLPQKGTKAVKGGARLLTSRSDSQPLAGRSVTKTGQPSTNNSHPAINHRRKQREQRLKTA